MAVNFLYVCAQNMDCRNSYTLFEIDDDDAENVMHHVVTYNYKEVQWLCGTVLDSRPRGDGFGPHRRHCVVSLSKIH